MPVIAYSQYLRNPSLEGAKGANLFPPSWTACTYNSTPDTQPGAWEVALKPSDGESYVSLVVRGNDGNNANSREDLQIDLIQPLQIGECYYFSIDLAISNNFGHDGGRDGWVSYNNPVMLEVWGGAGNCDRAELLWTFAPIDNPDWVSHKLRIVPQNVEFTSLIFETQYVTQPNYFGNVLIDNLKLTKELSKERVLDTVIQKDDPLSFEASFGTAYLWSPSSTLSCSDCANPTVIEQKTELYEVEITDLHGCKFIEEYNVVLEYQVPNVFTPNGDGVNDVFEIVGLEPNSSLSIYNRWGKLLYQTDNYENDWVGSTKERRQQLPAGTYFYVFKPNSATRGIEGTVQVLR